jgi:uncharacterized protein YndB with AHSA1/START domain
MKNPIEKLVVKRLLSADRNRVFSALTDPSKMAQWFYGMETGQARVTSDFCVGGKYTIEMFNPEKNCAPTGEFFGNRRSGKASLYLVDGWHGEEQQGDHRAF